MRKKGELSRQKIIERDRVMRQNEKKNMGKLVGNRQRGTHRERERERERERVREGEREREDKERGAGEKKRGHNEKRYVGRGGGTAYFTSYTEDTRDKQDMDRNRDREKRGKRSREHSQK